ncbi:hypothetical protein CALCODRAFT_481328, partial [Calocera cornea HHB12733]
MRRYTFDLTHAIGWWTLAEEEPDPPAPSGALVPPSSQLPPGVSGSASPVNCGPEPPDFTSPAPHDRTEEEDVERAITIASPLVEREDLDASNTTGCKSVTPVPSPNDGWPQKHTTTPRRPGPEAAESNRRRSIPPRSPSHHATEEPTVDVVDSANEQISLLDLELHRTPSPADRQMVEAEVQADEDASDGEEFTPLDPDLLRTPSPADRQM